MLILLGGSGSFCFCFILMVAMITWASWVPGWLCVLHTPSQCVVCELAQISLIGLQVLCLASSIHSYALLKTPLRFHPIQEDSGNSSPCPVPV